MRVGPIGIVINNPNENGSLLTRGLGENIGNGPITFRGPTLFNPADGTKKNQPKYQIERESDEGERILGNNVINFDVQCSRIRNSRKVRKNMREVFD